MAKLNSQVLKLAEQAKGFVDLNQHVGGDNGCMIYTYEGLNKFAELIVRECINKITTYDLVPGHSAKWEDIYDIHTRLIQDLGEELKEHFGVE